MSAKKPTPTAQEDRNEFVNFLPSLVKEILDDPEFEDVRPMDDFLSQVLKYNVGDGDVIRGVAVVQAYRHMETYLTEEGTKESYVLGWCLEIINSALQVADDLIGKVSKRRELDTWHKFVGKKAFYDAVLLKNIAYRLIKKYFGGNDVYADLIECIHDIVNWTRLGQSLDLTTHTAKDFENYNLQKYKTIAKYRTAILNYYAPARLAMIVTRVKDKEGEIAKKLDDLSSSLGFLSHIQDDYFNCYPDEKEGGREGTDIEDGKCTCLYIFGMQLANQDHKKTLKENYGINRLHNIQQVRKVYDTVKLPDLYRMYKEKMHGLISQQIREMPEKIPKQIFFDKAYAMFERKK